MVAPTGSVGFKLSGGKGLTGMQELRAAVANLLAILVLVLCKVGLLQFERGVE